MGSVHLDAGRGGGDGDTVSSMTQRELESGTTTTTCATAHTLSSSKPAIRLKISDRGVLYACKVVERPASHWVVVSGDDGVSILDWKTDILPKIEEQRMECSSNDSCLQLQTVRRHFKPYPSAHESSGVEVNDLVVQGNYLYGAAGDAFGCYKWDLETEKVVATYKSTRGSGYLHTLAIVPNCNVLLTGGEDGVLGIWDTGSDKLVDIIDMNETVAASGSSHQPAASKKRRVAPLGSSATTRDRLGDSRWISSCLACDENWWAVAGGSNSTHNFSIADGGFISVLHGPTRSVISTVETRETPQQLALFSDANDGATTLLSVANERYVSHWKNPLSLDEPPQRVWCNQRSLYAVVVSPDRRFIATGGVGHVVDIFEQGTHHCMQLWS